MQATASETYGGIQDDGAPSDDALLARVAAGDEAALGELYDRYGRQAFGLAFRVVRDRTLAEDAVQEAFLGVWRSAGRFRRDRGTGRAWLLNLVHRRAVDLVRREERRRRGHLPQPAALTFPSAEEDAWLLLERRRLYAALDCLPAPQRRLLELAYYGGLTQSEIAARLDLPLGTVKSRTSTALARLRQLLAEDDGTGGGQPRGSARRPSAAVECVAACA